MICIDSEYDEAAKIVADWRRAFLYPEIESNGNAPTILMGNMATREYFSDALVNDKNCFVSGSGHGTDDKFMDSYGYSLLEINDYDSKEVEGKIMHLLSCYTAKNLGRDLIDHGCKAFLGYDTYFTFPVKRFHNEFMQPDQVLVLKLCDGATVSEAHHSIMNEYDKMLQRIKGQGASPQEIQVMEMNKDHFCSPVKSSFWGDSSAKEQSIT